MILELFAFNSFNFFLPVFLIGLAGGKYREVVSIIATQLVGKQIAYNIKELKLPDYTILPKIKQVEEDNKHVSAASIHELYKQEVKESSIEELKKKSLANKYKAIAHFDEKSTEYQRRRF